MEKSGYEVFMENTDQINTKEKIKFMQKFKELYTRYKNNPNIDGIYSLNSVTIRITRSNILDYHQYVVLISDFLINHEKWPEEMIRIEKHDHNIICVILTSQPGYKPKVQETNLNSI